MVDPDLDPALVVGEVVDAVGDRLAELVVLEVVDADRLGLALGRHSCPPFLKSPTSSFFLVSTEIAGWPAAIASPTVSLMWRNCASRSGWSVPSLVLRLACRL